jgi:putative endonuclease
MVRREYNFYVYIVASLTGTLYIGFTNSLKTRINQHKEGKIEGFTKKYSCNKLIYYEHFTDVYSAISREKQIKKWNRRKKEEIIKTINPHWKDLYNDLFE